MTERYDAVIVGSGPNGLAAAAYFARLGRRVAVIESKSTIGGGMRTRQLTEPGFLHDICSAAHPMGILSPFLSQLPLQEHGLEWIFPPASVAHPLDGRPSVVLWKSLEETAAQLNRDARPYRRLVEPFMGRSDALFRDLLAPLKWPEAPLQMIRFGLSAIRSATGLARSRFRETEAQALFAGCAAHSIMDLNRSPTAALGLIFAIAGHCVEWPVIRGGTEQLAHALQRYLLTLGVDFFCDETITDAAELPEARVFMFDTSPTQMATICESVLPSGYRRRLSRYRYGPGVFKLDWALSEPIPWRDQRTASAATVHIGGRMDEIAAAEAEMWRGKHPDKPFVLLCQQSLFDDSRAPAGQHTGYAYCHVPAGSTIDQTDAIESQIERFAPGFRDTIIARNRMNTHAFERHNPNYIGGAITGGVADLWQLFTRPVFRLNPYSTPNRRIFLCSASTPPGGGVHGMCGYYAAKSAARYLDKWQPSPLLHR